MQNELPLGVKWWKPVYCPFNHLLYMLVKHIREKVVTDTELTKGSWITVHRHGGFTDVKGSQVKGSETFKVKSE